MSPPAPPFGAARVLHASDSTPPHLPSKFSPTRRAVLCRRGDSRTPSVPDLKGGSPRGDRRRTPRRTHQSSESHPPVGHSVTRPGSSRRLRVLHVTSTLYTYLNDAQALDGSLNRPKPRRPPPVLVSRRARTPLVLRHTTESPRVTYPASTLQASVGSYASTALVRPVSSDRAVTEEQRPGSLGTVPPVSPGPPRPESLLPNSSVRGPASDWGPVPERGPVPEWGPVPERGPVTAHKPETTLTRCP